MSALYPGLFVRFCFIEKVCNMSLLNTVLTKIHRFFHRFLHNHCLVFAPSFRRVTHVETEKEIN